jgi:hypothetical protein
MNVSQDADREFMAALEREDSARYERLMKNIRRDSPGMSMPADQALTNYMLGLPTSQHRFAVIAGPGAPPDPLRARVDDAQYRRTGESFAAREKLRKRTKQANTMRRLSRTAKSVAGGNTF